MNIHFLRGGPTGPPLLMLHGVMRRWQTFTPILPALSTRWEIHAMDFRGHGKSRRAPGRYRVVDYVEDAVSFLREKIGRPSAVYGHSLGAMVAAAAAAEAPELVTALVLEDPPFRTMGSHIRETPHHGYFSAVATIAGSGGSISDLARRFGALEVPGPGLSQVIRVRNQRDAVGLRFTAWCLQSMDPEVLEPIVAGEWLQGYRQEEIFRAVTCPALLLQAGEAAGGMLTDEDAAQFESLAKDAVTVKFPGVPHNMHWMATETVARQALTFLEPLRE